MFVSYIYFIFSLADIDNFYLIFTRSICLIGFTGLLSKVFPSVQGKA